MNKTLLLATFVTLILTGTTIRADPLAPASANLRLAAWNTVSAAEASGDGDAPELPYVTDGNCP